MVGCCSVPMVRGRCCEPQERRRTMGADFGTVFTMGLQLLSLSRARDRGGKLRNCKDEEEGCLPEIKDKSGRVEVNGRCSVRICWVGWVPVSATAEFFYV
ncbi:uncharacterized protein DS421_17g595140 [Arachis hypogaea]|nr:uncharacterized protein DS421_17g595140 [Arachis hypogaea]